MKIFLIVLILILSFLLLMLYFTIGENFKNNLISSPSPIAPSFKTSHEGRNEGFCIDNKNEFLFMINCANNEASFPNSAPATESRNSCNFFPDLKIYEISNLNQNPNSNPNEINPLPSPKYQITVPWCLHGTGLSLEYIPKEEIEPDDNYGTALWIPKGWCTTEGGLCDCSTGGLSASAHVPEQGFLRITTNQLFKNLQKSNIDNFQGGKEYRLFSNKKGAINLNNRYDVCLNSENTLNQGNSLSIKGPGLSDLCLASTGNTLGYCNKISDPTLIHGKPCDFNEDCDPYNGLYCTNWGTSSSPQNKCGCRSPSSYQNGKCTPNYPNIHGYSCTTDKDCDPSKGLYCTNWGDSQKKCGCKSPSSWHGTQCTPSPEITLSECSTIRDKAQINTNFTPKKLNKYSPSPTCETKEYFSNEMNTDPNYNGYINLAGYSSMLSTINTNYNNGNYSSDLLIVRILSPPGLTNPVNTETNIIYTFDLQEIKNSNNCRPKFKNVFTLSNISQSKTTFCSNHFEHIDAFNGLLYIRTDIDNDTTPNPQSSTCYNSDLIASYKIPKKSDSNLVILNSIKTYKLDNLLKNLNSSKELCLKPTKSSTGVWSCEYDNSCFTEGEGMTTRVENGNLYLWVVKTYGRWKLSGAYPPETKNSCKTNVIFKIPV